MRQETDYTVWIMAVILSLLFIAFVYIIVNAPDPNKAFIVSSNGKPIAAFRSEEKAKSTYPNETITSVVWSNY